VKQPPAREQLNEYYGEFLDVILQFIGLSFLFLGLLVLVWPKREDEFSFARTLRFLGAFGLIHGLIEWMELWREMHGPMPLFETAEPYILLLSYLFLFEFGRRLIRTNLSAKAFAAFPNQLLAPWIYLFMFGVIAFGAAISAHGMKDFVNIFSASAGPCCPASPSLSTGIVM